MIDSVKNILLVYEDTTGKVEQLFRNSILFFSEKVSTSDLPATIAEDQDVKEGDFFINFLLVSKMKCSHGTSFE